MLTLLNSILKIFQMLTFLLALTFSSIFHGYHVTFNTLETLWQGTQPPKMNTQNNQENSITDSGSNPQLTNHLFIKHRQVERIAQKLPNLPNGKNATGQVVAPNIVISAGDKGVLPTRLNKAGQIIKKISLPVLNTVVGLSPAKSIHIVMFSSPRTYANALREAGIDSNSIQEIIADTGGLTVDTSIWIPLYNLGDDSDLTSVLSHELFHACISSQGYDDEFPTWLNEGTAWRIGLMAMQKVNPQKTSYEMAYFEADVKNAAKKGTMLPLTASEEDILNAHYNVEYEDYLAVEQLVKQNGTAAYKTFIQNLTRESVKKDFQNTFNTSIENFQNSFIKSL